MAAHRLIAERIAQGNAHGVRLGVAGAAPDFYAKQPILAACRALILLFEPVLQLNLFMSMRLREALLFGKPLIVSDFGVVAAFVRRHGIGLAVPNTVDGVRAAMHRLSTDDDLYATLVANIRAMRDRYDMAAFVPAIAARIRRYNGE
ncbi:glycosyltransferase [Dactylosporangium sp. CS-047395]|uniref:glycosyltransferase n=1 Tax=Dactylosporangium sp. CS-047395 TaxID=3239936 RepID=UPI003D89C8D9